MRKTGQSVFLGLVLPSSIHFYLILALFTWGSGKSPFSSGGLEAMAEYGAACLILMAPVTAAMLVICPILAGVQVVTVLRIAPEFPNGRSQFLIGILNPSLGILTSILFIIGWHLVP